MHTARHHPCQPGEPDEIEGPIGVGIMFRHNVESFEKMWKDIGSELGIKLKVKAKYVFVPDRQQLFCQNNGKRFLFVVRLIVCKLVSSSMILGRCDFNLSLSTHVLAQEDDRQYADILNATPATVFFGTPHRGSKGAYVGKVVGRIGNVCLHASQTAGVAGTVRSDFLTTLGSNLKALNDLAVSSRNRLRELEIVTFYETEKMPGLSELV
jgi:hypothetical protein